MYYAETIVNQSTFYHIHCKKTNFIDINKKKGYHTVRKCKEHTSFAWDVWDVLIVWKIWEIWVERNGIWERRF